jgi:hypothetical protein
MARSYIKSRPETLPQAVDFTVGQGFGEPQQVDRAKLRALLRNRRDETNAFAKTREHSEATADPRWSVQFELDLPQVVGIGNPARA